MSLSRPTAVQAVLLVVCGAVMVFFGCLGALGSALSQSRGSSGLPVVFLGVLVVGGGAIAFGVGRLAFLIGRAFVGAFRSGSRTERFGLVAAPLVVVLIVGGLVVQSARERQRSMRELDALFAAGRVGRGLAKQVRDCAERYAHDHPDTGAPASLTLVGPEGTGCLDAATAAGKASNFNVDYLAGLPASDGAIHVYFICVHPDETFKRVPETIVTDDSGRVFANYVHSSRPCISLLAQFDAPALGAKVCLISFAAAHPDQGYPGHLSQSAPDDACFSELRQHATSPTADSLVFGENRLVYLAGIPDQSGRITRFNVYSQFKGSGTMHARSVVATENGGVHYTDEDRLATERDPARPESAPRTYARQLPIGAYAASVEAGCDDGSAAADRCEAAAELAVARGDRALAIERFSRLCDNDNSVGCFRLGQTVKDDDASSDRVKHITMMLAAFRKACDAEYGPACEQLGQLSLEGAVVPLDTPQAARFFTTACADGMPGSCYEAAKLYDMGAIGPNEPALVDFLFRKACVAGDPTICPKK